MMTPEQEKEWARRVAEVTEYVDGGKFSNVEDDAVIAVNDELVALRQIVEDLRRTRHKDAAHTGKLWRALTAARVALVTARDVLTRLGEEDEYMLAFLYDRETEPVLAAIDTALDTALGKEGALGC